MVQAVLVWVGAVLAIGLLLVMALGPVIVAADSWFFERRHDKSRAARTSARRDAASRWRGQPPAAARTTGVH